LRSTNEPPPRGPVPLPTPNAPDRPAFLARVHQHEEDHDHGDDHLKDRKYCFHGCERVTDFARAASRGRSGARRAAEHGAHGAATGGARFERPARPGGWAPEVAAHGTRRTWKKFGQLRRSAFQLPVTVRSLRKAMARVQEQGARVHKTACDHDYESFTDCCFAADMTSGGRIPRLWVCCA